MRLQATGQTQIVRHETCSLSLNRSKIATESDSTMSDHQGHRAFGPPLLSVVMPVYNERSTIEEIILRVQAVDIEKELIIVDDFSKDGTREYLMSLAKGGRTIEAQAMFELGRLKILFQDRNYGKGAALRRGFQEATGQIVVIQDADLELNPQEYGKLITPIQSGIADVVYGSRFLNKKREDVPPSHYWGNKLLTAASNICTGLDMTDVWTGYKTFRREVLDGITLRENRFAFEPEFTAKIARRGWRMREVPVSYSCRNHKAGKKISWKDGFRGLACTFYYGTFSRFHFGDRMRTAELDLAMGVTKPQAVPQISKQL
jgi:glycosyltransferase involved in cell wall biosynthesis